MKKFLALLCILPFLVLIGLLFVACGFIFLQSLGYIPALGLTEITFSYYAQVLSSSVFWQSMGVSVWVAFTSAFIATLMGTFLCAVLVRLKTKKGAFLVRIPILIPHIVVALFVIMLFSQTGLLARVALEFGWINEQAAFPQLLFTQGYEGVIIAYLWKEIPFVAYFTLALMSSINAHLGEAAENLGASPWKSFFSVTLPLSFPAISKACLIIFIFAFGGYELPLLLGATLPKALPVEAYFAYTEPDLTQRPYAMAIYAIMLIFCLVIAFLWHMCTQRILKHKGLV